MSGLENLKIRLAYDGGIPQKDRMIEDKLKTLKKALLYSYQSATIVLEDGREFRGLINPDTINNEFDNKYLSIPFEDISLNNKDKGVQPINLKTGDTITWKENGSDWLVYLQRLEEIAYFRAELRRCKYTTEVGKKQYKIYITRPHLDQIDWRKSNGKTWNELDYSLIMFITKDQNTIQNLHRFTILTIDNKPWEIQAVDSVSSDGIVIVALKEYYKNSIQDEVEAEKPIKPKPSDQGIQGPTEVFPYDTVEYFISNQEIGSWDIDSQKCKILQKDEKKIKIMINTGRSGNFTIKYKIPNKEDIILEVKIKSL